MTAPWTWLRSFENSLVYLPSRHLVATPEDYGLPYRRIMLEAEDGVRLMAWEIPHAPDAPWLIYFHGNGENISRYLPVTTELHGLGLNVLMLEYRGYGESEGTPSEAGLYLDARAAYHHLIERNTRPTDIILYGYSLGSGVAIDLASEVSSGALIAEAPYTSIPAVARAVYKIIPERLLLNRYASIDKIARVDAPILILHARSDRTVPFAHGLELYERASTPKTFVEMDGDHAVMLAGMPPREALEAIRIVVESRR